MNDNGNNGRTCDPEYEHDKIAGFFHRTYPYSLLLDIAEDDVHMAMHMYPDNLETVIANLEPRQQDILDAHYKRHETFQYIADRYGMSRQRICQITDKAVRRIRQGNLLQLLTAVPSAAAIEKDLAISKLEAERDTAVQAFEKLLTQKDPDMTAKLTPKTPAMVLQTDLDGLELSVRAYNCLYRAGIMTLGDIARSTRQNLLSIRNLGVKTVDEIEAVLAGYGLRFAPDHTNSDGVPDENDAGIPMKKAC